METTWKITYTKDGEEHVTNIVLWGSSKPSENDVAVAIKEEALHDVVLIDQNRGTSNHTVLLLEHHGVKITGIDKVSASI